MLVVRYSLGHGRWGRRLTERQEGADALRAKYLKGRQSQALIVYHGDRLMYNHTYMSSAQSKDLFAVFSERNREKASKVWGANPEGAPDARLETWTRPG